MTRFMLSPNFIDTILDNSFGIPSRNFQSTEIYVGLGIEFDEEKFEFTKEPVSKGYTIVSNPVAFNEPVNGVLRNAEAIEWDKATQDWTIGDEKIKYIGLYYRLYNENSSGASGSYIETEETSLDDTAPEYNYELLAVLPLVPSETVLMNEKMVLNANAIQIRLANR